MNLRQLYQEYANNFSTNYEKPEYCEREIYLDNNSTTPCDSEVLEAMLPFFKEEFGNPNSTTHNFGRRALNAVDSAKDQIIQILKCSKKEFIFTSGATESSTISIKGVCHYLRQYSNKKHIITLKTEHKCNLDNCKNMQNEGYDVTYLGPESDGLINLEKFTEAIRKDTALAIITYVNNELGTIQPVKEIYQICKDKGVILYLDAAQAVGRVEVTAEYADLISFSAHKFYGPKGIGGLYIKRGVRITSSFLHKGTPPVPLCVGMAVAMTKAEKMRDEESKRISRLRNIILTNIMAELPEVYLNSKHSIPDTLNLSFSCIEGESLMVYLDGIAVSSGSACTSSSLNPSHVLEGINVDEDLIHSSIRIGIGRFNTEEEILYFTHKIITAVQYLRKLSPLWDLKRAGVDFKTIQWTDIH